jgi:chromosome partitioning protein
MSNPILSPVTLDELDLLSNRASTVIDRLRDRVFAPGAAKGLNLRFNVRTAAQMVGRSDTLIREAENEGRLPPPEKDSHTGRRTGYSLHDVNNMRQVFGTLPHRDESDEALVLAVQNFKGGVGKSTLVTHIGQYLALQGYRVCIVDCDSQASTTSIFGLNPDVDIDEEEETLYPFFRHGGPQDLRYALRATYWPGIALIAANLGLYDAEYELAGRMARESSFVIDRLREGINSIRDHFDIILLDPPPALGMISLSVLRAADAILVPTPPNNVDFGSTVHFLKMMHSTLSELEQIGGSHDYKFVKVVATKMNDNKSAHVAIKRMMDAVFSGDMLGSVLKDSAEIDNATANLQTVYEITGPGARTETHKRCRAYLDAIGRDVEILMRKTWPSQRDALGREGLL